jgi:exopolysaccharide biosynthesis predicted pyruvyltransferase EpsI
VDGIAVNVGGHREDRLRDQIASKKLFDIFKEYRSRPFVMVEPYGNHGDALIARGAYKLARLAGIQYKVLREEDYWRTREFSPDCVLYIHGGGMYNPIYRREISMIRKAITTHKGVIIQGPQTFCTEKDYLTKTIASDLALNVSKRKVHLFVRELTSRDALAKCLPSSVELELDHDTALNLDASDLVWESPMRLQTIYAIRRDKEATGDLGENPFAIKVDPAKKCKTFEEWVRLHNRARRIVTNRTHSAVLGAILGVPTVLVPNNYHKNRSVWEYSLRQRGVLWEDAIPVDNIARLTNSIVPLRKMLISHRFQELRLRHLLQ